MSRKGAAGPGPDRRLERDERLALSVELADHLRAAVSELPQRVVADADLIAAVALMRSVRDRLTGPRRPRWYEGDATALAPEDRTAYLDQSPIRGRLNPIAPPFSIETVEAPDGSRRVVGRTRLSAAYEGPPRGVHGGWVAALLDELLGTAQGLAKRQGVTAKLEIRYRAITPIDTDLHLEAWVAEERGRILRVRGTCHAGDTLTAEAEGLFARVDFNQIHARGTERGDEG